MSTSLVNLVFCLTLGFMLCQIQALTVEEDDTITFSQLHRMYGARTPSDWRAKWTSETIHACKENLLLIKEYACFVDIHKSAGRKRTEDAFVDSSLAHDFLRGLMEKRTLKRYKRASATSECCAGDSSCVWEELAEYCTHQREVRAMDE
ncbi:insulin-like peptide 7 [Saccoglossus kowalevskii]|uniref:Probable insulin-like peptide 7-like n=1 Tax=Saccoglossus kowalevskii TaxID=10224 RepID=A0ABM0M561_SACKO|nr:PREDICTED: probable insulin-like peptide 7-like [Saccoglossus kowalevskii]